MKEAIQARMFYNTLTEEDKAELWETLAENIFFLEEELQHRILELLKEVDRQLCEEVKRRNDFTTC